MNPYPSVAAAFVAANGDQDQLSRLLSATRPPERPGQVKRLAAEILFRPTRNLERWKRIEPWDIPHVGECRGGGITFAVEPVDRVPDDREIWDEVLAAAKEIGLREDAKPRDLTVVLRRHVGLCTCGGKVQSLSALVSFHWAGMVFSREYAI